MGGTIRSYRMADMTRIGSCDPGDSYHLICIIDAARSEVSLRPDTCFHGRCGRLRNNAAACCANVLREVGKSTSFAALTWLLCAMDAHW